MALPLLIWPLLYSLVSSFISWVFRKAIIAFLIATAIYFAIDFLAPLLLRFVGNYLTVNPLALLNDIPQSIWWFAAAFKIDFGIKAMFSALATRFLIRRIPLIG